MCCHFLAVSTTLFLIFITFQCKIQQFRCKNGQNTHFLSEKMEMQKMEIPKASGECSDAAEGRTVQLKDALLSGWRRVWRQCPVGHIWKAAVFSRAGPL